MRLNLETLEARDNPSSVSYTPKVPLEMWQDLAADVQVLVQGTTKPSQESVQKLYDVVTKALEDGTVTKAEQVKITAAATAVLNSANIPPEELQAVAEDLVAIRAVIQGSDADALLRLYGK